MIHQIELILPQYSRGYHLISDVILENISELPEKGLLNIFIQHTSAGITINENFDPTVRKDFEAFFNKLIPDESSYFVHDSEGDDDMPAHLKASIIGQSLTIPITNRKLNLGTWQGVYLCEFRNSGGNVRLWLHYIHNTYGGNLFRIILDNVNPFLYLCNDYLFRNYGC